MCAVSWQQCECACSGCCVSSVHETFPIFFATGAMHSEPDQQWPNKLANLRKIILGERPNENVCCLWVWFHHGRFSFYWRMVNDSHVMSLPSLEMAKHFRASSHPVQVASTRESQSEMKIGELKRAKKKMQEYGIVHAKSISAMRWQWHFIKREIFIAMLFVASQIVRTHWAISIWRIRCLRARESYEHVMPGIGIHSNSDAIYGIIEINFFFLYVCTKKVNHWRLAVFHSES